MQYLKWLLTGKKSRICLSVWRSRELQNNFLGKGRDIENILNRLFIKQSDMDKQSAIELLCSQEQFHNEQIFEMKRQQVFENQIWQMLGSLNIVPFKDGNQWCCLYGKDLMSGIAGFGDTPYLAAVNLYEELNKI